MSIVNALVGVHAARNINPGQNIYTTPGSFTWTCPNNVYQVSVLCIGGGGGGGRDRRGQGGGGGGLAWANYVSVLPGQQYSLFVGAGGLENQAGVGANGSNSWFISDTSIVAYGGQGGNFDGATVTQTTQPSPGGSFLINGYIGSGGTGGGGGALTYPNVDTYNGSGGGGAAGYIGSGGRGTDALRNAIKNSTAGEGGGAGGGGATTTSGNGRAGIPGGGVGIFGLGSNGYAGSNGGGGGGSGGTEGVGGSGSASTPLSNPGSYGGGGGGGTLNNSTADCLAGPGANGAVRILWGNGRFFPNTLVSGATS
jgi:hypothetical protein